MYCMYRIQGNLTTRYRGKDIVFLFKRAVETYNVEKCDKLMVEIRSKSFPTLDCLTKIGIEHWAQSHYSRRRYNMMT